MTVRNRADIVLSTYLHGAPTDLPPFDPAAAVRALGAFCDTPFASATAACDAALELIMQFVGMRSAFISRIVDHNLDLVNAHNRQDGCGIPMGTTVPLTTAYCQYVRADNAPVIIPDAAHDARVQQLAVRMDLAMAAYVGVPLHRADGSLYGTLCAADPAPRPLDSTHAAIMQVLAQRVMSLIEREELTTVLLRAEEDAQQDVAATLQLIDQQNAMLHTVAHDMRAPLSAMRGYIDLIAADVFGPVWPKQREALAWVQHSAQSMNRLINDIVDMAALEAQTFALLTAEYQPDVIARQVVDMCQFLAASTDIALRVAPGAALPTVVGDADRVQQVLINLVSNALRYTKRGSVEVATQMNGDDIMFRVTDTGPGIAPDVQAHIWERYTRASGQGRGVGLGLYVVHQLTKAMGGTVGVDSTDGQGSSFWVRLPRHAQPPHFARWE